MIQSGVEHLQYADVSHMLINVMSFLKSLYLHILTVIIFQFHMCGELFCIVPSRNNV